MINWRNLRVLIIEDETDLRDAMGAILSQKGARVFSAANGQEGLEIVARETLDVIISDVRMPVMGGIEFLDRLRAQNINAPVIVLASGFTDITEAQAKARGATALIQKPFPKAALFETVETILKGVPG